MKFIRPVSLALVTSAMLLAHQAGALSEDDKTMSTPGGGARFSDPDEQMPIAVNLQGGSATGTSGVDPSSVRYDYDPASGAYVPHKN